MISITFDSNVLECVIDPGKEGAEFQGEVVYQAIHNAIESGSIKGYYSDTYLTLEAIEKDDRRAVLGSRHIASRWTTVDGVAKLTIGAKMDRAPINKQKHFEYARKAASLGIRPLKGPPILGNNMLLDECWYEKMETSELVAYNERMYSAQTKIAEDSDCTIGKSAAICYGLELLARDGIGNKLYTEGFFLATNQKELSKVIAEQADEEGIVRHIGRQNDYFCTLDQGKSAGTSILNPRHRKWLLETFQVNFVTPFELSEKIKADLDQKTTNAKNLSLKLNLL